MNWKVERRILRHCLRQLVRVQLRPGTPKLDVTDVVHKAQLMIGETPRCRICGCTERRACAGGCSWTEPDLCSRHP